MNSRFDGPIFTHPIHAGLRAQARATYDGAYDVPHGPIPAKIIPATTRTNLRLTYWPQLQCCGDGSRRVHDPDCLEGEIDRRASILMLTPRSAPLTWPEARYLARAEIADEGLDDAIEARLFGACDLAEIPTLVGAAEATFKHTWSTHNDARRAAIRAISR